jgi:prefoldin subunit 5
VQATWSVCETLPQDLHEVFDFAMDQRVIELKKLFPEADAGVPPEAYNRMLSDYLRDGQPAEDTDPPENVWIRVKFERDFDVVVDAAALVSPINSEMFDSVGQAQAARLQRGEPVKFKKGDTGLFDKQTADTLMANGTASLAEGQARIFRRKLNDYENAFASINRRIVEIRAAAARADQHLADLKVAIDKANEQIRILEGKKTMLNDDLTKVAHERDELSKYRDKLHNQLTEVRAELSRLYGSNLQMQKDLKAASDRLTEEIDRRTREATAASTP